MRAGAHGGGDADPAVLESAGGEDDGGHDLEWVRVRSQTLSSTALHRWVADRQFLRILAISHKQLADLGR
jgi:hypothetical protein